MKQIIFGLLAAVTLAGSASADERSFWMNFGWYSDPYVSAYVNGATSDVRNAQVEACHQNYTGIFPDLHCHYEAWGYSGRLDGVWMDFPEPTGRLQFILDNWDVWAMYNK